MLKIYISATKFVLKNDGAEISENKYLLTSVTKACEYRTRLPSQRDILNILLRKTQELF